MSDDGERVKYDAPILESSQKQLDESDDDEFGEFGEFEGEENPSKSSLPCENVVEPPTITQNRAKVDEISFGTKIKNPLISRSTISKISFDEIQQLLTPPPPVENAARDEAILEEDSSITSKTLWQHLTATEWVPLPKWEGSSIHRQLILHLGIPLDLDSVHPEGAGSTLKSLYLPSTQRKDEIKGSENIPYWTVAMASEEAINSMDSEELTAHIAKLEDILQKASALKDALEAQLMDLDGQKYILNGMVKSWLMFFQTKRVNQATPSAKQSAKIQKDVQRKNKEKAPETV